jgi:predicted CxxxxCH...CXXCH cytochrome family protein
VGAHQAHLLPGVNAISSPIACAECHVVPTDLAHVGPTATTPAAVTWGSLASANGASPALAPPPPGSSSVSCSNVYCHSGGPGLRIGGGTLTSPTWNPPSAVTCGSCHALPGGSVDTSSWHPAVALGADCGLCHAGYTRVSVNQAVHVNGQRDVIAPGLQVNCTACHGDPTRSLPPGTPEVVKAAPPVDRTGSSSTSAPGVGAHQSHLVPGASAISLPVACSECHVVPTSLVHVGPAPTTPATLDWGPLASAKGATPSFDSTAVTCSNYCHGQTLPAGGGSNTQPKWTTVNGSQAACGTCHAQPPDTGQHLLHTTTYTLRVSCGVCHPGGYSPGVVGFTAVPLHVNGQVNMNPNGFTDWDPVSSSAAGWRGTATGCHGGTRYWFPGSGGNCR